MGNTQSSKSLETLLKKCQKQNRKVSDKEDLILTPVIFNKQRITKIYRFNETISEGSFGLVKRAIHRLSG